MKNSTKRKKAAKQIVVAKESINLNSRLLLAAPKLGLEKTGCMNENLLLLSDSYKESHWMMLPEGTQKVYSYFESRKGAEFPYTVFFGLQMTLKKYLAGIVITQSDIDSADKFCKEHFGMDIFNRKMWEKIVNVYGGKLPLKIKAVPEGFPVSIGNVMMTVENTDDDCAPLTNFVETLLTHVWYSSNVATISRDLKMYLKRAFEISSDNPTALNFMLHDFGFRGVSSVESAGIGGAGHLVNFMGTDTIIAITYAQRYYGAGMAGFSVPASEHSVMTSLGEVGELEMIRSLLKKFPKGIISIVSDSYNIKRVVSEYLPALKAEIMARDGKVVIRPDSPREKGDTAAAQVLWLANSLYEFFGGNVNTKGFKVLNPHLGLIYGDGLSPAEIKDCIKALVLAGFSAETSVYGMGGGLLQKHNRDTQCSAFKCSAQLRNGKWIDICKKPLDITKASKAGRLKLVWGQGSHGALLTTVPESDPRPDVLVTVFENGEIVKNWTWEEVRANAEIKTLEESYN
jgi:nicotinamide phosphoribosyltransferase